MASESVFNYFIGGLALLSTVFSMLVYLSIYLPGPRMKVFDELLAETVVIYEKAQGENLLPPEMSRQAQAKLQKFEAQGDDLRVVIYHNLSPVDILISFFGAHSSKIAGLSSDLRGLRRDLLTTSQKERARRREELLEQERNSPMRNDISQATEQLNHNQDDSDFPSSPQSIHITAECAHSTLSTTSSNDSTPRHLSSISCIRSIRRWMSQMSARRNQAAPHPRGDDDQRQSLSDIEPCSRSSSTLVEEPLSKDSPIRRYWSSLARWVRGVDTPAYREDLEARLGASSTVGDTQRVLSGPR